MYRLEYLSVDQSIFNLSLDNASNYLIQVKLQINASCCSDFLLCFIIFLSIFYIFEGINILFLFCKQSFLFLNNRCILLLNINNLESSSPFIQKLFIIFEKNICISIFWVKIKSILKIKTNLPNWNWGISPSTLFAYYNNDASFCSIFFFWFDPLITIKH